MEKSGHEKLINMTGFNLGMLLLVTILAGRRFDLYIDTRDICGKCFCHKGCPVVLLR
jgi:hypothetical protein